MYYVIFQRPITITAYWDGRSLRITSTCFISRIRLSSLKVLAQRNEWMRHFSNNSAARNLRRNAFVQGEAGIFESKNFSAIRCNEDSGELSEKERKEWSPLVQNWTLIRRGGYVCLYICVCVYIYTHFDFIRFWRSPVVLARIPNILGRRLDMELPMPHARGESRSVWRIYTLDKNILRTPTNGVGE